MAGVSRDCRGKGALLIRKDVGEVKKGMISELRLP